MVQVLYACDELSGFVTAVALVRPGGLSGMKPASIRKKMKQKSFAASVNREDIIRGCSDLSIDLNEHIQFVIHAMQEIAEELELSQA